MLAAALVHVVDRGKIESKRLPYKTGLVIG